MDAETIREARRLIRDLVMTGEAMMRSGHPIAPKDDLLVQLLEKIAGKKLEEKEVLLTVDDYIPKETYHAVRKDHIAKGE